MRRDGVSRETKGRWVYRMRFASRDARYLQEIHEQLKDGSYRPHRVEIPKGYGTTRPCGFIGTILR
jgi:hypothetical protein